MISFLSRFCLFFSIALYLLVFSPYTFAAEVYHESYESGFTSDNWTFTDPVGFTNILDSRSVSVVDNIIDGNPKKVLRISGNHGSLFPSIALKYKISDLPEYTIRINFTSTTSQYGFGLSLLSSDPPPEYSYTEEFSGRSKVFTTWPYPNNKYVISTTLSPEGHPEMNGQDITLVDNNHWTDLLIQYKDGVYKLYLENNLVFTSEKTERKISYLWVGNNKVVNNPLNWGDILIEKIQIIVPEQDKVDTIIIPGLGASWDDRAIISGEQGANWEIPSFVTIYQNLISSFENSGYEKGKDLFIFTYDWRKNIDVLAEDFKAYLDNLHIDGKVNVVGHSMGGLVARAYAQKYTSDNRIEKLIMVGSPNRGSTNSYGLWEGGLIWNGDWWQQASIELMSQLNRRGNENKIDALRRLVPSIKDMLPTYDYIEKNGSVISWNNLSQKNNYLGNLDSGLDSIKAVTDVVLGQGEQTREKIKVTEPSWVDKLFGMWQDGKPVESDTFTYADGDDTVIAQSAISGFDKISPINTSHGGLIYTTEGIEKIFSLLELDKEKIVANNPIDQRKGVFLAALASPGKLHICKQDSCDNNLGILINDGKEFLLPGYSNDELKVEVVGDGNTGEYKLNLGRVVNDEPDWQVVSGELKVGNQVDRYVYTDSKIEIGDGDTGDRLLLEKAGGKLALVKKIIQNKNRPEKLMLLADELRLKLIVEMKWADWRKKNEIVREDITLWQNLDKYLEYYLKDSHKISVKVADKQKEMAIKYLSSTEKKLKKIKTVEAYNSLANARRLIDEANRIDKKMTDIRSDKYGSANGWLTAALLLN